MTHRILGVGGYGFWGSRLRAEAHLGASTGLTMGSIWRV